MHTVPRAGSIISVQCGWQLPSRSAPAPHALKLEFCRMWCNVRLGTRGSGTTSTLRVSALPTAPFIKVCGVTTPMDAAHAATAGANLIGMIMWPPAPRALSVEAAQAVAAVAREHGAEPVGVFVDEDAETIARRAVGLGCYIDERGS